MVRSIESIFALTLRKSTKEELKKSSFEATQPTEADGKIANLLFLPKERIEIFGFIFSINNYIGNVEKTINADGIGYYDYLTSIFIYNDFIFLK